MDRESNRDKKSSARHTDNGILHRHHLKFTWFGKLKPSASYGIVSPGLPKLSG